MSHHVVILGGGVAGLSAAHELIERGFRVSVYEARDVVGGKARTIPVPGSGTEGRRDLPGEHGFRFFPRFYRHMPDTMKRIPFGNNRCGVFDNLDDTTRLDVARFGGQSLILPSRFPRSVEDLALILQDLLFNLWHTISLRPGELDFFARRLWQILTSCEARRFDELEKLSWWDYIEADGRSDDYKKFLAIGLSRSLVAAQAKRANAKVVGEIILQLLFDMTTPGVSSDRVLNAPTTEAWLDPWKRYLEGAGVEFHLSHALVGATCEGREMRSVTVKGPGGEREVSGDYYVFALPVEVLGKLLGDGVRLASVLDGDPTLRSIEPLSQYVQWMNGVQFFLKRDVTISPGHMLFLDSPWALTAISERQFWPHTIMADYGDGQVQGVISACVSDWDTPGVVVKDPVTGKGKTAKECTRDEIVEEVWGQLKLSLNTGATPVLTDDNRHASFLDPDITYDAAEPDPEKRLSSAEPLFVAYINTWDLRPDSWSRIKNLFVAGDYVRTNTQLATMEAANESARRAVNGIVSCSGSSAKLCEIWPLNEPKVLFFWRMYDQWRFNRGLPWSAEPPAFVQLPQRAALRAFEVKRHEAEARSSVKASK